MFLSDSRSVVCGRKPPPICGAIITGANNSMSKLTMVPWNAGSATPTTVIGTVFRCIVRADDVGIGGEGTPPQTVAQNDDGMPARRNFIRRQQRAADLRADAELLKVVAGDELAHHAPRSVAEADVDGGENAIPSGR